MHFHSGHHLCEKLRHNRNNHYFCVSNLQEATRHLVLTAHGQNLRIGLDDLLALMPANCAELVLSISARGRQMKT